MVKSPLQQRVALIILPLLAVACLLQLAVAQAQGDHFPLARLPLPTRVSEIIAHAQGGGGELFCASKRELFIRSPFGDASGWERVIELEIDEGEQIRGIAYCPAPSGETLLVATERSLYSVQWRYREHAAQPWGMFRYAFEIRRIEATSHRGNYTKVYSFSGASRFDTKNHSVQGWVATSSAELVPILNRRGQLMLGQPIDFPTGTSGLSWAAGPSGWSYVWLAERGTLWTLGPEGRKSGAPIDLRDLMVADGVNPTGVGIRCVWLDEGRNLLFVGTNQGLAVGQVEAQTGRVISEFVRVEAAKNAFVRLIGATAGRVWFVTSSAVDGFDGPIVLEATYGRRCRTHHEAARMSLFEPVEIGDRPATVVAAVQVDDDRVLIKDEARQLWVWTMGSWSKVAWVEESPPDLNIAEASSHGTLPLIVSDSDKASLWYAAPDSSTGWYTRALSQHASPNVALVPDPSGLGVWSISPSSRASVQYESLAFHTPHGTLHGDALAANGPTRIGINSLSVQLADGEQRWPVSQHGGLVLPSGGNFVHADSGFQTELIWPLPRGVSLQQMLPGAESSDTAWLAIQQEARQPQRVVRVDLSDDTKLGETPRVEVRPVGLQCREGLSAVLAPDSQGNIWFAVGIAVDSANILEWSGQRISPENSGSSEKLDFGALPVGETPRLLWLAPDRELLSKPHALFTERGLTQIPQKVQVEPGELRLLGQEHPPPGAWHALFPNGDARQVRTAVRSQVLARFEDPNQGLLLTDFRSDRGADAPDDAHLTFEFSLDNPATTLKPVLSLQERPSRPLQVVMWSPKTLSSPELVVWSDAYSDASKGSLVEVLERDDNDDYKVNRLRLDIPQMGTITQAVRVPVNYSSDVPNVDFAVSDGSHLAMHRQAPHSRWGRLWIPGLPVEIGFRDSKSGDEVYRVAEATLPSTLQHTIQAVEVLLAPSYTNWWMSDLSHMTLAHKPDLPGVRFSKDGHAALALLPGEDYELQLTSHDPLTGDSTSLVELPLSVAIVPVAAANPIRYIAITLGALTVLIVIAAASKAAWRRALAAWLFRQHWSVVVADCHIEAEIGDDGDDRTLRVRTPRDEEFCKTPHIVPSSAEWLRELALELQTFSLESGD